MDDGVVYIAASHLTSKRLRLVLDGTTLWGSQPPLNVNCCYEGGSRNRICAQDAPIRLFKVICCFD